MFLYNSGRACRETSPFWFSALSPRSAQRHHFTIHGQGRAIFRSAAFSLRFSSHENSPFSCLRTQGDILGKT